MKYLLLFSTLIISSITLNAQSNWAPLNFRSAGLKLGVTNDEHLILITKVGEIAIADSINSKWKKNKTEKVTSIFDGTLENINLFNRDTGIISGFINRKDDIYDILYRTVNGGKSWDTINFKQNGWVDDVINLKNGEAWLSVSGADIAYSKDYGLNWDKLKIPNKNERYSQIFFNSSNEGLIGSLNNSLAYTNDNCKTWKILKTPLDQKKYNKSNDEDRPQFNKVAIYKNYFIVQQEEFVFYRNRDSLEWNISIRSQSFSTDPENTALFLHQKNGYILKVDDKFNAIFKFKIENRIYDATCNNGNLYLVGLNTIKKINDKNEISETKLILKDSLEFSPDYFGINKKGNRIGSNKLDIYEETEYEKKYLLIFTLPNTLEGCLISQLDKNNIICNIRDSMFEFNLTGNLISKKSVLEIINSFSKSELKSIQFENGNSGCYNFELNQLKYEKQDNGFKNPAEGLKKGEGNNKFSNYEAEIGLNIVEKFISNLESILFEKKNTTIKELEFTEKEYFQCKKDIEDFKNKSLKSSWRSKIRDNEFYINGNNIDYQLLSNLVDSLKNINPIELNISLKNLAELYSTSRAWKTIEIVNINGDKLKINSVFYEPNAFYFPWNVELNGLGINSTDIRIYKFINEIYPTFLEKQNRINILHKIVKDMYYSRRNQE